MKNYKKPYISGNVESVNLYSKDNVLPGFAAFGVAMALAKGKIIIDSNHNQILNERKKK